jgi:hypothetical protein
MIPPPPCAVHAGQEADRRPGPATSTTSDGRRTRPPSSPHPLRAPLMRLTRRHRPISRNPFRRDRPRGGPATAPRPASCSTSGPARTRASCSTSGPASSRLVRGGGVHLGWTSAAGLPPSPRRVGPPAPSGRPRRPRLGPPRDPPPRSSPAILPRDPPGVRPATPNARHRRPPMPATGDPQCPPPATPNARHRGPPGAIPTGESHRVCPPRQVARRSRSCPAHRAFTRRRHPARRERHPPDPAGPADALPRHDPAVPGAWKPNGSGHGSRPTRGTHPGHRRRGRRAFTLQCG